MALKSKQERECYLRNTAQNRAYVAANTGKPYNPYRHTPKGSHNFQNRDYKNAYSNATRYVKQITYLEALVPQYPTGPLKDEQQGLLNLRKQQLSSTLDTLRSIHVDVVNTEWFKKASNLI